MICKCGNVKHQPVEMVHQYLSSMVYDGYAPFSESIYIDHVFDVIPGTIYQHIILLL